MKHWTLAAWHRGIHGGLIRERDALVRLEPQGMTHDQLSVTNYA